MMVRLMRVINVHDKVVFKKTVMLKIPQKTYQKYVPLLATYPELRCVCLA